MAKGVSITYGDVAPEAKENFAIDVSEKQFDTIGNLQTYNMQLYDYANPCEMYQTVLDGTAVALPSNPETANIGLWSEQLSNDDGTFTTPITVTLTSDGQYSSQGFTLTFDKFNEIYPTRLTIQWFRVTSEGIEDLSGEMEFNPTSAFYFCRNQVENFNKVVIKFYALNMPKNRLKLEMIDYGYGTVFYGDELRNVKISQSIDPISSEIPISNCDFTLDSKSDMEYSFQAKQPISVNFNNQFNLFTAFTKTSKRNAAFLWDINSENYIGVLDQVPFVGGMYTDEAASDILTDIFTAANVPYSVDASLSEVLLSGHIPYTTCREALMQVCFASMSIVNTANTNVLEIKKLSSDIKQTIPLERIMQGQSFTYSDIVTQVELTAHSYQMDTVEEVELYTADSGTGEDILVKFSEPIWNTWIENGKIKERGTNYAIINAYTGCILKGNPYMYHTTIKTKKNPVVLASAAENVASITNATLVSSSNVDAVLEHCFDWLTKSSEVNLKIAEHKNVVEGQPIKYGQEKYGTFKYGARYDDVVTYDEPVQLGDLITVETEYLGEITGRVIKQSYSLNGNILVKDTVVK